MKSKNIVIAYVGERYKGLIMALEKSFPNYNFLPVDCPENLDYVWLSKVNPDYIFFPHWSWIIAPKIYEKFECIVFHMTDLPYGRGGSPLQNLIARGFLVTKISALRCEKGIDSGPIYLKKDLSLSGTAEAILRRASKKIESMIIEILRKNISPKNQEGEIFEFKRRTAEDGNLFTLKSLDKVYDYIRMLDADGYPNAFISNDTIKFEFSKVRKHNDFLEAIVRIKKIEK